LIEVDAKYYIIKIQEKRAKISEELANMWWLDGDTIRIFTITRFKIDKKKLKCNVERNITVFEFFDILSSNLMIVEQLPLNEKQKAYELLKKDIQKFLEIITYLRDAHKIITYLQHVSASRKDKVGATCQEVLRNLVRDARSIFTSNPYAWVEMRKNIINIIKSMGLTPPNETNLLIPKTSQTMIQREITTSKEYVEILDVPSFMEEFSRILQKVSSELIIVSPYLSARQVGIYLPQLENCVERGVRVTIYTRFEGNPEREECVQLLRSKGIDVYVLRQLHGKAIIVDRKITYVGGINVLSGATKFDWMIKTNSTKIMNKILQDLARAQEIK